MVPLAGRVLVGPQQQERDSAVEECLVNGDRRGGGSDGRSQGNGPPTTDQEENHRDRCEREDQDGDKAPHGTSGRAICVARQAIGGVIRASYSNIGPPIRRQGQPRRGSERHPELHE